MADDNVEQPDAVSRVDGDIRGTFDLANTFIKLMKVPTKAFYQKIAKAQRLKRSLGCWEDSMFDSGGCRILSLPCDKLENYLVEKDGVVSQIGSVPSPNAQSERRLFSRLGLFARNETEAGQSASSNPDLLLSGRACWVYLLFALGIKPEMEVVGWRPAADGFVNAQNDGIEMEIEGGALCHIINLYSITLDPNYWARGWPEQLPDRLREKRCEFSFGNLVWTTFQDQVYAYFKPGLENKLRMEKRPFGGNASLMEPNTFLASYYNALERGVSKEELQLAPSTANISDRVNRLLGCFDKMMDSSKPVVVSYNWFAEASNIKRRVLANGGDDHTFFEDVCAIINASPSLNTTWSRSKMTRAVRELFLLDDETFTFWVPGVRTKSHPFFPANPISPMTFCQDALARYQSEPAGSRGRELFDMREVVTELLCLPNKIVLPKHLILLEFTKECDLWRHTVHLGAP